MNDDIFRILSEFTKYFTDLGFYADIMILYNISDSMERFESKDNSNFFEYKDEKN